MRKEDLANSAIKDPTDETIISAQYLFIFAGYQISGYAKKYESNFGGNKNAYVLCHIITNRSLGALSFLSEPSEIQNSIS